MGMINEFLLTLPFSISNIEEVEEPISVSTSQAVALSGAKKKKSAPVAELDEILAFCVDHNLHATVRGICRVRGWAVAVAMGYLSPALAFQVASRRLAEMRLYGKAVEYCAKTADSRALNRVVGALSNEYLLHGKPLSLREHSVPAVSPTGLIEPCRLGGIRSSRRQDP